jgi:hypothetical protein
MFIVEVKSKSIIDKNHQLLHDCIYDINHRLDYYKSPDLALRSIISKEIKESFEKVSSEIRGFENENLNISFDEFVKELISYDCLGRIDKQIKLNRELYKMFYDNNDYKDFTLEKFEGHVVNSPLFRKVFLEFYPNKIIPIAVKRIDEYKNTVYDIVDDIEESNIPKANPNASFQKNNNDKMDIKNDFCGLDNTEKSFLFHVMCKALSEKSFNKKSEDKNNDKTFNLPGTELCKLSMIIDVQNKNTLSSTRYGDSEHYKILNKGIEFIEKKIRISFINTLLEKIKDLKLIQTTRYIKGIREKEHIKSNKHKN